MAILRARVRKWARLLTLGLTLVAIMGLTGFAVEQAFELVEHGHFGHDLPGEAQRHLHDRGDPFQEADWEGTAQFVPVEVEVEQAPRAPCPALAPDHVGARARAARRTPTWEPERPTSRSTGPPHRPPIA
jgi:hypothetical protein